MKLFERKPPVDVALAWAGDLAVFAAGLGSLATAWTMDVSGEDGSLTMSGVDLDGNPRSLFLAPGDYVRLAGDNLIAVMAAEFEAAHVLPANGEVIP